MGHPDRLGGSTLSTDARARSAARGPFHVRGGGELQAHLDRGGPVAELRGQLLDRSLADQLARREDPDPVADRLDLAQQVARQHDRQPTLVDQATEELEDLDDPERVDRGRRLIEDEEVGRLHERIGDPQPLPHPARVRADEVVGAAGQADLAEDLVDGGRRLVTAEAVEPRRVAEVLASGHPLVEADGIGQVADPPLDLARLPGGIEAHDLGLAVGRLGEAEQHEDGRGLAGPVLAEEPEDLARVDREVEVVDRGQRPVLLRQPPRPDDRGGTVRGGRRLGAFRLDEWRGLRPAHRRPNRRKVHSSPIRTMAMSPIPMMPHSSEVSIVIRISVEVLATGAVALNVVT